MRPIDVLPAIRRFGTPFGGFFARADTMGKFALLI